MYTRTPYTSQLDEPYPRLTRSSSTHDRLYNRLEPDGVRFYGDAPSSSLRRGNERFTHYNVDESAIELSHMRAELLELETTIRHKDQKLEDVEKELMNYRDIENQQTKTIRQLQEEISQCRIEAHDRASSLAHAEARIAGLDADNRSLSQRLADAEKRLNRQLDEHDSIQQQLSKVEKDNDELRNALMSVPIVNGNAYGSIDTRNQHDTCLGRLKQYIDHTNTLQHKVNSLASHVQSVQSENKRLQDSIAQLLEDNERSRHQLDVSHSVKAEKESALRHQEQLKQELKQMQDRVEQVRMQYDEQLRANREQGVQLGEAESLLRQRELTIQSTQHEFKIFRESISSLLSDGFTRIQPTESSIRERLRAITSQEESLSKANKHLDEQVKELTKQLEEQAELHKNAVQRAKLAEVALENFKDELRAAKGELHATDILKNGWSKDKDKYTSLLNQLAQSMQMHKVLNPGTDIDGDTLLARAQYLSKVEAQLSHKVNVEVDKLRDELKAAHRDLETKDTHLELLRKKLVSLDASAHQSMSAEKDFDEVVEMNKKLVKQVDKQNHQLAEAKTTIQSLKSEHHQLKNYKTVNDDLRRQLHDVKKRMEEYEQAKHKLEKKYHEVRRDESEVNRSLQMTESSVHSLTGEVHRLKQAIADSSKREKQLADLRHVIARMLGLNADKLAVPDYEIISRMEKLIESQHLGAVSRANAPSQSNGSSATRNARNGSVNRSHSNGRGWR